MPEYYEDWAAKQTRQAKREALEEKRERFEPPTIEQVMEKLKERAESKHDSEGEEDE